MATDTKVLKDARELIENRLREINEETRRLERAVASLKGERRGPGRPRGSKSKPPGSKNGSAAPTRRRRGGTRTDQALKLVAKNPGITGSQIAAKLKSDPNYIYRVMGGLVSDGKVRKDGRGYLAL